MVVAPEHLPRRLLEPVQVGEDLIHEPVRQPVALEKLQARFGRDREAGRDVEPQPGHLAEAGTLAPQQELVAAVSLIERVDVFLAAHAALPPAGISARTILPVRLGLSPGATSVASPKSSCHSSAAT